MNPPSKSRAKQPAVTWDSPGSPQDLGPVDQAAHAIVIERPDLRPSVQRIMSAALTDTGKLRALGLFGDALTTPGDPNRDPRVAIAQCADEATEA